MKIFSLDFIEYLRTVDDVCDYKHMGAPFGVYIAQKSLRKHLDVGNRNRNKIAHNTVVQTNKPHGE